MTRRTLEDAVGEALNLPHTPGYGKPNKIVQAVFKSIVGALQRGESVHVMGLGKFHLKTLPPRKHVATFYHKGRRLNPTGPWPIINLPAKTVVTFRPSRDIRITHAD